MKPQSAELQITLLPVALLGTAIKLLLLPAAHSTDFEVHRYWKALTHTLPLSQWYTDDTSRWTLDYPPLFAYFECLLSHLVAQFDPRIVDLQNHDYAAPSAVALMRGTVILTDVLLVYAVWHLVDAFHTSSQAKLQAYALALLSPGLVLVDNIHFQYNGLPIALLLLSVSHLVRCNLVRAAATFSIALNVKHTLLPVAPAVAVYILATLHRAVPKPHAFFRALFPIAVTTIATLVLPWLPLYFVGGPAYLKAILPRLFPFDRGLLHANWPPNFWALYASLDRLLLLLGFRVRPTDISTTGGTIGGIAPFGALPNPTPAVCTALIVMASTPCITRIFVAPDARTLVRGVVGCALAAFVFGWHVHEKAVLPALLMLACCAGADDGLSKAFVWLAAGGQLPLLELVRAPAEALFVAPHLVAYCLYVVGALVRRRFWLSVYLVGCAGVEVYAGVLGGHRMLFGEWMPFLPIMAVAGWGFIGVAVALGKVCVR